MKNILIVPIILTFCTVSILANDLSLNSEQMKDVQSVTNNQVITEIQDENKSLDYFIIKYNNLVKILGEETFNLESYSEQKYAGQRILVAVVDLAKALNTLSKVRKTYYTNMIKNKLFKLKTTQGASIVNISYLYSLGIRLSAPNHAAIADVDNSPIFTTKPINESLKAQESILKDIQKDVIENKDSEYSEQYIDFDFRYSLFLTVMEREEEERTLLNVYDRLNALTRALNALPKEDKELYTQKIGSALYVFVAEKKLVNISWLTKHVEGTYGINNYKQSPIVNSELSKFTPKVTLLN